MASLNPSPQSVTPSKTSTKTSLESSEREKSKEKIVESTPGSPKSLKNLTPNDSRPSTPVKPSKTSLQIKQTTDGDSSRSITSALSSPKPSKSSVTPRKQLSKESTTSRTLHFEGPASQDADLDERLEDIREARKTFQRGQRRFTVFDEDLIRNLGVANDEEPSQIPSVVLPEFGEELSAQSSFEETPTPEKIDREFYLNAYKTAVEERRIAKKLNAHLHGMMVKLMRQEKVDYALELSSTTDRDADLEAKYQRRLLEYNDLVTQHAAEQSEMDADLTAVQQRINDLQQTFQTEFDALQQRQLAMANDLSEKGLAKRHLERQIKRQRERIRQVSRVRVAFLKIRMKVQEKEKVLRDVETLSENLKLADFEQLTFENQMYKNKTEERDDELMRLRVKATKAIQNLAHLREKSHCLAFEINAMTEQLRDLEEDVSVGREDVNKLNLKHLALRKARERLDADAGLLTSADVLKDFDATVREVHMLEARVNELRRK